jgi:hypothetical protein
MASHPDSKHMRRQPAKAWHHTQARVRTQREQVMMRRCTALSGCAGAAFAVQLGPDRTANRNAAHRTPAPLP